MAFSTQILHFNSGSFLYNSTIAIKMINITDNPKSFKWIVCICL